MIVMDSKAQLTADIIAKVAEGKMDVVNAATLLNKSRRTIERYLQRNREVGIQFVVHQNTGKASYNKTCDRTRRKVQSLIKKKYFDLNLTHLGEMLVEKESIHVKRETLRSWAHEIHHVKRAKRRRSQVRKRRERKGLFKVLYVDKAGIFGGPKRCNFSQVKRACEELGIEIIFVNSARGKGRIERSFDTFQDRFIPELRLKRIKKMSTANRYLQDEFIPNYWQKNDRCSSSGQPCWV